MQWYVRHRETEISERFFAPAMGPERGLQPQICNRVIRADDMPEGAPDPDIVVSKGSVSNDNTGEGSGLGDAEKNVFADVDVA